jgi:putative FmdB family regulatory protein
MYEFYCPHCHTIFTFLSRRVNTGALPPCPRCGRDDMRREVSPVSVTGSAEEPGGDEDAFPGDEARMERALESLASEAEGLDEEDPRQAARLMRRLSDMTGMQFGGAMEEALARMEAGEDPEKIEEELGDQMNEDELFQFREQQAGGRRTAKRAAPHRDPGLYDM